MVPEQTWVQIQNEIAIINNKIQTQAELTDNDFIQLDGLVKQVEGFGKEYTRAINQQSKQYKAYLAHRLNEIGYDAIKQLQVRYKQQAQQEIAQRMTAKINKFHEIVKEELEQHPLLNSTGLKETAINLLMNRFPKINSGSKDKEIKKWEPIQAIVRNEMDTVETILANHDVIRYLPMYSNTFKRFSEYLRIGDPQLIANVNELLKSDTELLRNLAIKNQMATLDDALNLIQGVLTSTNDSQEKLAHIKQLILIWETM